MTLERDAEAAELFGLTGTFPRPGWVVLDAARDHRFTGEVVLETTPEVRVYLDQGRIYLAERVSDPSLGARLIDAGALNAAQLEHGSLRLGEAEYLGRLFERVPSVDRHTVLVTAELMTDECIGWVAGQPIRAASSTPYRHHPSGAHRWDRPTADLSPGDPLPAPAADEAPVEVAPPEPLFSPGSPAEPFDDDMIRWDEPSWLDPKRGPERDPEREVTPSTAATTPTPTADPAAPSTTPAPAPAPTPPTLPTRATAPATEATQTPAGDDASADWVDRLEEQGLPEHGSDPLSHAATLPPLAAEPDRFELIWPSGEIDDRFGATDTASLEGHHPDRDRAGPTARLVRGSGTQTMVEEPPTADVEVEPTPDDQAVAEPPAVEADDEVTDDVVLAVRRAVASIETGSLAARRRLIEQPGDVDTSRGTDLVPPGRVAVREEPSRASQMAVRRPTRSVFDEVPPEQEPAVARLPEVEAPTVAEPATEPPTEERTGALRRLIGSLRRR